MNPTDILNEHENKNAVYFDPEKLNEFLSEVEILEEKDTTFSDMIRILKYDENILVQEMTDKNEIAIRKFEDFDKAKEFINERLETYERMWDGCGCKVEYYD